MQNNLIGDNNTVKDNNNTELKIPKSKLEKNSDKLKNNNERTFVNEKTLMNENKNEKNLITNQKNEILTNPVFSKEFRAKESSQQNQNSKENSSKDCISKKNNKNNNNLNLQEKKVILIKKEKNKCLFLNINMKKKNLENLVRKKIKNFQKRYGNLNELFPYEIIKEDNLVFIRGPKKLDLYDRINLINDLNNFNMIFNHKIFIFIENKLLDFKKVFSEKIFENENYFLLIKENFLRRFFVRFVRLWKNLRKEDLKGFKYIFEEFVSNIDYRKKRIIFFQIKKMFLTRKLTID